MMIKLCIGRPHIAIPCLANANAKVDIVKSHLEILFIQTADFLEDIFSYDQTGSRYSAKGLNKLRTPKIARSPSWKPLVGVPSYSTKTQYDSTVLKCIIGIPQACTNSPHPRLTGYADHFTKPISGDDFDIIVDQTDKLSLCFHYGAIIQSGIIEWSRITDNTNPIFVRNSIKIS